MKLHWILLILLIAFMLILEQRVTDIEDLILYWQMEEYSDIKI